VPSSDRVMRENVQSWCDGAALSCTQLHGLARHAKAVCRPLLCLCWFHMHQLTAAGRAAGCLVLGPSLVCSIASGVVTIFLGELCAFSCIEASPATAEPLHSAVAAHATDCCCVGCRLRRFGQGRGSVMTYFELDKDQQLGRLRGLLQDRLQTGCVRAAGCV
jgi:hypothetical protein